MCRGQKQGRGCAFEEPQGPVFAWNPELGEEGGTQPCEGPCCQLGSWEQGSRPNEPVHFRMGWWQASCNQMCMFQRLLSASEPGLGGQQLKAVLDLVHSSWLSRHCLEPRKMMVEPSRAGVQTGLSDVIGV